MPAEDAGKQNAIWNDFCQKEIDFFFKHADLGEAPKQPLGYRVPMEGELVEVVCSQRRPELNGCYGKILAGGMDERGRVNVCLYDEAANFSGVGEAKRRMKICADRLRPLKRIPALDGRDLKRLPKSRSDPALRGSGASVACSSAYTSATSVRSGAMKSTLRASGRGVLAGPNGPGAGAGIDPALTAWKLCEADAQKLKRISHPTQFLPPECLPPSELGWM
eukprot:TRINITY_DN125185_c0_g1_i1.p1 TRINITY_DN125185_c0_g1~~TRINITY_DN125185_c0_g1_i1.p1  ORF type:complete len:245 (-),score=29.16 TRINITY_DN125185_c0_g1_i1:118-780(-)